ncbi:hypothetical protein TrLO_g46 [Triparma laevis f. longispina]|uniref:t-SNARE coiled-coil homology domain-containing protein n=1 Tax=Triparma laevis f. longispina TaxID=1714387 RepID=A0A9W7C5A0_9STRA|nr:hypothetical protein TrLO_g46 [Triparma laevis f. longispina]
MSGFGAYEIELQSLLAGDLASTDPTKFASETQTLLEQLKLESRNSEDRKATTAKYKQLKADVDRKVLLGGGVPQGAQANQARARLMQTNDKLENQNDKIKNIQNTVAEIEDVGGEITTQLKANREVIQKQQDRVKEVSSMADMAGKITKRMSKWWA